MLDAKSPGGTQINLRCLLTFGSILLAFPAVADDYPSRPIRLIAPFAAGGPNDTVARLLAQAMGKEQKQTIVVENISGAGGNIGATYVSRAKPDGYTLLFHQLGMAISPALYDKLEYDALKDFEYIGLVAYQPNVLISRPSLPARDFSDLLSYLKSNKDKLSFASTGPGGASHLCAILFMSSTGIDIKSVPYRATSPALTDVIAGNVDLLCDSVATATPYVESGKVKAHGVTGLVRSPNLPEVPTLDEQGIKGFDMVTWTGLYAPKNTPKAVLDQLVAMLQRAVQDKDFQASLLKLGSSAMPRDRATPDGLSNYLRQEMARWAPIIKHARALGQ